MTDDDLLLELGALQHKRDAEQEDWEALARGEVSASRLVESSVAAGADRARVEQLASVLGPPAGRERWVEVALAATRSGVETPKTPAPKAHQRRSTALWWATGMAALAAALVLLWMVPPQADDDPGLPMYTVVVRNETVQTHRGDASSEGAYRTNSDIRWVVQPNSATSLAHEVAVLARRPGTAPQLLFPPHDVTSISADGVVQLRGRFGAVFPLEPGRWELQIVVGRRRPADISDFESGGPWQVTAPTVVNVLP